MARNQESKILKFTMIGLVVLVVVLLGFFYFSQHKIISPETNELTEAQKLVFSTFGNVSYSNGEYLLTEERDAGIFANITTSEKIYGLSFEYRFVGAGDGDFLALYLNDPDNSNDSRLEYLGPDLSISRDSYMQNEISIPSFPERTQLIFRLVSRGQPNAVLAIKSIRFVYNEFFFENKSLSYCKKLSDSSEREQCIAYLVSHDKDIVISEDLCNEIKENNFDHEYCLKMLAVQNNDPSLCEKTGTFKNVCYVDVNANNPNPSLEDCKTITTSSDNWKCYAKVAVNTGNISICEMIDWPMGNIACRSSFAVSTENISICAGIDFLESQAQCYAHIGVKKNDSSLCNNIQNTTYRDLCGIRFNQYLQE